MRALYLVFRRWELAAGYGYTTKLASVAPDVMGVSGRAILRALLAGVVSPEALAELAKGRLRKKKQDL
jgi:transposase